MTRLNSLVFACALAGAAGIALPNIAQAQAPSQKGSATKTPAKAVPKNQPLGRAKDGD